MVEIDCTYSADVCAGLSDKSSALPPALVVSSRCALDEATPPVDRGTRYCLIRIAELETEIRVVREQSRWARLVRDNATDYALITFDRDGHITSWNIGAQLTVGYAETEVLGRSGQILFTSEDRTAGTFAAELRRAAEAGRVTIERWHLRRDGVAFWASGVMLPLLDAGGRPEGFLNIFRECTELQALAERRDLLMGEMSHRIKNVFSVVQAVAAQTQRHAASAADYHSAFDQRLRALAHSFDTLGRNSWESAPLCDVIDQALAAYRGQNGRIIVQGPSVLLAANQVVSISLAFHELATNAAKYGALSTRLGAVTVTWAVVANGRRAERAEITLAGKRRSDRARAGATRLRFTAA